VYNLFDSYLADKAHVIKQLSGVVDVGAGSGILSAILAKYVNKKEKIYAVDINRDAVETINMNKNILGLQDKIFSQTADIVSLSNDFEKSLSDFLHVTE
jgi:tRNA A58 N-methylase Trm61